MRVVPDPSGPKQESVWSYPRPPVAEASQRHLKIVHRDFILASTRNGVRTLETSHPPTYYLPLGDVAPGVLRPSRRRSLCEWKGEAVYFDVVLNGEIFGEVAWSYPEPTSAFESLRNHIAFYAWPFDQCSVDDERVTPQPGDFYGGWITSDITGPFKGVPGSRFW
jgi:uncharacterized protein (DUF427 family)